MDENIEGDSPTLEEFRPNGSYTVSNSLGYYIQLSSDGETARVQNATDGDDANPPSEWLPVEYVVDDDADPEDGHPSLQPVIDPQGYAIPLNKVMRIK